MKVGLVNVGSTFFVKMKPKQTGSDGVQHVWREPDQELIYPNTE